MPMFPKGILRTARPKMKNHRGRTWDSCDVRLPDGKTVEGWLDTSWGNWFYFPFNDQWYKGRIVDFEEPGSSRLVNEFNLQAK